VALDAGVNLLLGLLADAHRLDALKVCDHVLEHSEVLLVRHTFLPFVHGWGLSPCLWVYYNLYKARLQ
jgi:hypothetical protein